MNPPLAAAPDDADLVAWLDGELEPEAAARVRGALRAHAPVRARVGLLRAARAEFAWALDRPHDEPPRMSFDAHPRWRGAAMLLLAAAAVAVVLVIATAPRGRRDDAAENAWLSLRVVPVQTGWDLFSCIRFELEGTARTDSPCDVLSRTPGEADEAFLQRAVAPQKGPATIPLTIDAEVTGPDGVPRSGRVARASIVWQQQPKRLVVELADAQLPCAGICPRVDAALDLDGAHEDFWWGLQRVGPSDTGGVHGFVPEQPGEYRIRFTLRPIAPTADVFPEPLSVATGFAVRGAVGAWSEPVDGMRARIVASRERVAAGELVFAVQLRNESDRARTFNVTGSTIARIPQPYHFDLVVDGDAWQQRADLGTITAASESSLPLRPGAERTVVVLASYWERDGARFPPPPGAHRLAVRFHSEASVFDGADKELWQGKIDTPAIAVEVAKH